MMQVRSLLSGLVLATLCAAPSGAELRDVSYGRQADQGLVWLSFDEQPQAVTAHVTETGLELSISGVNARPRDITPYRTDLVTSLRVLPQGDAGVRVNLTGHQAWAGAHAEVYSGGVLVRFGLSGAAVPAIAATDHAPADAINRTLPGGDFATRTAVASAAGSEPAATAEPVDHTVSDAGPAGHADSHDGVVEPSAIAASDAAPTAASRPSTPAPHSAAPGECAAQAAAVEQSPWDDERLFAHAACLSTAGDLPRAAGIYEQMLAFEPENFRALIALAELRAEQGDDAGARDLYSQAASHAISDAEAARARARLRELRGN